MDKPGVPVSFMDFAEKAWKRNREKRNKWRFCSRRLTHCQFDDLLREAWLAGVDQILYLLTRREN